MKHVKLETYKINVEEMPEEIQAQNLNEAVAEAHNHIDVQNVKDLI